MPRFSNSLLNAASLFADLAMLPLISPATFFGRSFNTWLITVSACDDCAPVTCAVFLEW